MTWPFPASPDLCATLSHQHLQYIFQSKRRLFCVPCYLLVGWLYGKRHLVPVFSFMFWGGSMGRWVPRWQKWCSNFGAITHFSSAYKRLLNDCRNFYVKAVLLLLHQKAPETWGEALNIFNYFYGMDNTSVEKSIIFTHTLLNSKICVKWVGGARVYVLHLCTVHSAAVLLWRGTLIIFIPVCTWLLRGQEACKLFLLKEVFEEETWPTAPTTWAEAYTR